MWIMLPVCAVHRCKGLMTPTRAGWDRLPAFQRRRHHSRLHILKHFFQMLVNTQVYSASIDKHPLLGMGMRD